MGHRSIVALIAVLWASAAFADTQSTYTLTVQSQAPMTIVSPSPSPTPTPTNTPAPTPTPTPAPTPTPITSTISITSPPAGSTVSGSITVSYLGTPDVGWANLYVDGKYIASNGSGSSGSWPLDTTKLTNKVHAIKVIGYSATNVPLASAQISVTVANGAPTPTPSPSPTSTPTPPPSPTPTRTPTPNPTPSPIAGTTFFIDPAGNDANTGTDPQHAWATVAKANSMIGAAQPGTRFLQLAGGSWNEQWMLGDSPAHAVHGTVANPIQIGIYGQTQANPYAILDEQNTRPYCINAVRPTQLVNGLVVSGIECKHATQQGMAFRTPNNQASIPGSQQFQGISIVGNYIHNVGHGCAQLDGPCVGDDSLGGYMNALALEDDDHNVHSFYVAKNIVRWAGGHNCTQIHGDTGSSIFDSNIVGPGCSHDMADWKIVGDSTKGYVATVTNNWLNCGFSQGLCSQGNKGTDALFSMNVNPNVNEDMLIQGNWAYDIGGTSSGYAGSCINMHPNATNGGCPSGAVCPIVLRVYNNFCYGNRTSATIGIGFMPSAGVPGSSSIDARNNIIDGFGQSVLVNASNASIEDYNNIGGAQGNSKYSFNGAKTPGGHSVVNVDPKYVNASVGNYNLKAGSPMINAGTNLNNNNLNIGAYAGSGQ